MDVERPIMDTDQDPEYRCATDEARELGILIDAYKGGSDDDPHWEAYGRFDRPRRQRGRWIDDVWVDSDDDYDSQPEPIRASAVANSPSKAIRSAVRLLVDRASI